MERIDTDNAAQAKMDWITQSLNGGKTVYVCTYTRATKITKKTVDAWNNAGRPLFRVSGNSLYMGAGKRYDCIDFCALRAN